MVHDILISVYHDIPCDEIHPTKKNTLCLQTDFNETGKATKKNTKTLARPFFTDDQWKFLGPKKDDVADSVA
jgi:hypothetical protein